MSEERSEESSEKKFKDMTMDEILDMWAEIRTDLDILKEQIDLTGLEDLYEYILNRVDLIGCELTQNIAKKLKEK